MHCAFHRPSAFAGWLLGSQLERVLNKERNVQGSQAGVAHRDPGREVPCIEEAELPALVLFSLYVFAL